MNQHRRLKLRWVVACALPFLVFFVWTTDRVTIQGERTVHTLNCVKGAWVGDHCNGELTMGPRVRFRALKARGEVLFWTLGSNEPSAKLTGCSVQDGRNWTCPVSADAPRSITLAMVRGEPVTNPAWPTRPFHAVSKVRWTLFRLGLNLGQ